MARRIEKSVRHGIIVEAESNEFDWYQREALGVILSAIGLFFTIALISYNPRDTGLFYYDSDLYFVANWAGSVGAVTADFLNHLFGLAAYLVVASLLYPAYLLLFKRSQRFVARRLAALPVLVVAAAAACSLYQLDITHSTAGGQVGFWVEYWLAQWAGVYGSALIVWAALWVSVVTVLRVSVMQLLGRGVIRFSRAIAALVQFNKLLKVPSLVVKSIVLQLRLVGAFLSGLVPRKKNGVAVGQAALKIDSAPELVQEVAVTQEPVVTMPVEPVQYHQVDTVVAATSETVEQADKATYEMLARRAVVTLVYVREQQRSPAKKWLLRVNSIGATNWFKEVGAAKAPIALAHASMAVEDKEPVFVLPDVSLFAASVTPQAQSATSAEEARERGKTLVNTLLHFGIKGSLTAILPGPVITMYEYKPDANNKISKITALEDDLAMALQAVSIRIIAPIPGKDVIGFEIANRDRAAVYFAQVVASPVFEQARGMLPFIIGVDVAGQPVVEDLTSMPHLLVSGTTGSGKSVGLNVLLMSMLCKKRPDQLRIILVDPKRLEFTPYADIPHLLFPIVTNPLRAVQVLKWVVQEMEQRYERMAHYGVRNVGEYQALAESGDVDAAGNPYEKMPFIVVMIDELADLMMVAGKEVETSIIRIAQMARAAGIHLILATQRPSVDVVTGIIKVNFPSRMAFRVSSKVDSRTILDQQGAEKLLGKGDLLFMNAASPVLMRVHGPYVSDKEITALTTHLKQQKKAQYLDLNDSLQLQHTIEENEDSLYGEVLQYLKTTDEISISSLQRHYRIGFNRSARIIEKLEMDGLIAPAQGSKPRRVLREQRAQAKGF